MDISLFNQLGLSKIQQTIYLYLLEYGQFPAGTIAKRLGIKRSSTYAALDSLTKQNLVSSFMRNKVAYYEALSPEEIANICISRINQEKVLLESAQNMVKQLKKLQEKKDYPLLEVKGELKYYRGKDAVAKQLNSELTHDFGTNKKEHLNFGYDSSHRFDIQKFIDKRVASDIYCRTIMADSDVPKDVKAKDDIELRTTHLLPKDKLPPQAEFSIVGDTLNLYAEDHGEPIGIQIYNPSIVKVFKSMFELIWTQCEKGKG